LQKNTRYQELRFIDILIRLKMSCYEVVERIEAKL